MNENKNPGFKGEFTHSEHGAPGSHEESHKKSNKSAVRKVMTGSPEEQEKIVGESEC